MVIGEVVLTAIINAIIGCAMEKGTDKLGKRVRGKLGLDPIRKALSEALNEAFQQLHEQHPQWVGDNFDASFFQREGAPVLAQFLLIDGQPDASELASRWADSLNMNNPERRAFYIRQLEPIAVDFLEDIAHQLKSKEALRELNIGRTLHQSTEALQALRRQFGAEKATFGTRQDYLRWLIGRNFYLDPRGTYQTQRQVQVKLDEIYISLQAQRDEATSPADREALDRELANLEAKVGAANLASEELEDRRDQLHMRFEGSSTARKAGEVLELAEVVTRYDRVVILGDPGSGKSTLVRYLALKHAEALRDGHAEARTDLGLVHFPILLRIAEYAENGIWKRQSLSDFLADCFTVHDCPKQGLADLLQSELEKGDCLVLLDGLDEIVSAGERLGVVRQIEDFIRRYGNKTNRFVVTSRIAGYLSAPLSEPFTHYIIREMNKTHIRRFLEHWCQAVEDAQTPALSVQERQSTARREIDGILQAIQNPGVLRLAVNPLMLRILALIHRTGAKLPQKRIELYKLAADTLAQTWRPAQGVSESAMMKESALLKPDFLTPLLSTLAYWLHVSKPTGIATEREVYNVIGEAWAHLNELRWDVDEPNPKITEEIRKFLMAVHEHTGLFVERAPRRYGFMHLTFEEYYVARHLIVSSRKRAKLIRQHLHQPRWEEPILLSLGFIGLDYPKEASELFETAILAEGEDAREFGCFPSQYEDILGRDFLFALRCLGDNIPTRPMLLKRLIERLANELLHSIGSAKFSRYRSSLDERLTHLGGSEGGSLLLSRLVAALHDANDNVRSNAARSLGQLGQAPPEAVSALVAALHDANDNVRRSAAQSLGQLGQAAPEAVSALVVALHDANDVVRSNAAWSLGQLGQAAPEEAISALVAALHDANDNVCRSATQSLGQLGQAALHEAVSALVATLHDANDNVRSNAARSLGQLGQAAPEAISALVAALHDANDNVRSNAAQSLGQLGQAAPEAVSALVAALHDANDNVCRSAAQSLGQLGQAAPEAVSALVVALHDANDVVRSNAAWSLGQLGQAAPEEVISALVTALHDANDVVRRCAARSLGQLGQAAPGVVQELCAALRKTGSWVERQDAARLLGQLGQGDPTVLDALRYGLLHSYGEIRTACAQALSHLGRQNLVITQDIGALLVRAIQDPQFDVPDEMYRHPAYEYAYESLWLLIVG